MGTPRTAPAAMMLLLSVTSPGAPTSIVAVRTAAGQHQVLEPDATEIFRIRVDEYVALHRRLEVGAPRLRVTTDITETQRAVRALGYRIQAARAGAKQGDIITPQVATLFRRQINECLPHSQWAAILLDMMVDEEGDVQTPPPALRVNMEWPEGVEFAFVPPALLAALPQLPDELQFRLIGRALVLWDHHANLIVDFLPEAFTALT